MKPRVLFVGHTRYALPLPADLARKWDALASHLDYVVLASAAEVRAVDARFELVRPPVEKLESVAFYASLPIRARRLMKAFEPHVVVAQSPYEAAAILPAQRSTKPRPKLVVEVHGDWRTAARLYGSSLRGVYAPLAERVAVAALRRADATRAISPYTARLVEAATGKPPLATFATYSDLESFTAKPPVPLPARPTALWVGALERVKNPAALARAWPRVAARIPDARLVIVGRGRLESVVRRLVSLHPDSVEWVPTLRPPEVASRLDAATVLVLPSLSEGFGRVVVEAFCRGRPVIASAVGAIPDLVTDGANGVLIRPRDVRALEHALLRVLSDRDLAVRLGTRALADAKRLQMDPAAYARATRELIDNVLEQPP